MAFSISSSALFLRLIQPYKHYIHERQTKLQYVTALQENTTIAFPTGKLEVHYNQGS